jgi:hypothetical protein
MNTRAAAVLGATGSALGVHAGLTGRAGGRLWYLPAALLITSAALTVENWRGTLAAAAWRRSRTLLILGAIPFAAVAWTAVVPVVLAVEAFAVYPAVRVSRRSPRR